MAEQEVRVGVIGTGMGRCMQAYSEIPGVRSSPSATEPEVVSLPSGTALARLPDYRDMCARQAWTRQHRRSQLPARPFTLAALDAGLHVLCEKPMATTLEDAEAMVAKARQTGKRLMVHMNNRFRDSNLVLGQMAPAGELGQVYYGRASMIRRRSVPTIHFLSNHGPGPGS